MKEGLLFTGRDGAPHPASHLVLDFNGTLARDGALISGVAPRLRRLARTLDVVVATADTFGSARRQLAPLPVALHIVSGGPDKARLVQRLGGRAVIAIGNGANDAAMFQRAGLAIAVLGPEGLAGALVPKAHVICAAITDALDLLLRPERLRATLRR